MIAGADLNSYKIPVASTEGSCWRCAGTGCTRSLWEMLWSWPRRWASPPQPGYPRACSALSRRFMQYGHSNKTIFNVTLSSGNPQLRLSPNREQKENCHVNISADSSLLLFSFFPRLCVKSASSSLHCQMKLLYNTSRSMWKPQFFTGGFESPNVSVKPKTTGESGWLLWASKEVFQSYNAVPNQNGYFERFIYLQSGTMPARCQQPYFNPFFPFLMIGTIGARDVTFSVAKG